MSNRVTNQEAKAFATRHNQFGKALKTPAKGGPSYRQYDEQFHTGDFRQQHPRYPDYAYPDDQEEDTRTELKWGAGMFYGAAPQIQLSEKDIDFLQRKKEAQQLLRFKSFVEDSIPRGTPWAKEYFEKIMPGWYQSKIDIINDKLSMVQRFIEITIRGPQSIDDMFLLYNLYQGNITLPDNFANLIRDDEKEGMSDAEFHTGLFNPRRYISRSAVISKRNQDFLANFTIPGIDLKGTAADPNDEYGDNDPSAAALTQRALFNLNDAGDFYGPFRKGYFPGGNASFFANDPYGLANRPYGRTLAKRLFAENRWNRGKGAPAPAPAAAEEVQEEEE